MTALALAAGVAGCTAEGEVVIDDPNPSASLRVINASDFVIEEIYLTEVDNPDWGPNLLRGDVLFPDEDILLGVPCDYYDALVVDEDGVECEVYDLDLCLNDATWTIRNNTCTVWDAARRTREAADQARALTATP